MTYSSVDRLQKSLADNVFNYARDSRKAAGRALGTIVEVITFYLLESWGLTPSVAIETRIPEYGRPEITHNVEYSLHPVLTTFEFNVVIDKSLTANRLLRSCAPPIDFGDYERLNNTLLTTDGILRNACRIAQSAESTLIATRIEEKYENSFTVSASLQHKKPFALFECKRVGIEEGAKRGPQTIEKAKQGAYVARTVSSLQKVRLETGDLYGVIYDSGEVLHSAPYHVLLNHVVHSQDPRLLRNFVLTSGVVSNHGNWFTAQDHNRELKVLAQSYDWLLFLSDDGLTSFLEDVILNPLPEYSPIRHAFRASYGPKKKKNQFTKVQMNWQAHKRLLTYFAANATAIENWFNVISPENGSLGQLREHIHLLQNKQWLETLR